MSEERLRKREASPLPPLGASDNFVTDCISKCSSIRNNKHYFNTFLF